MPSLFLVPGLHYGSWPWPLLLLFPGANPGAALDVHLGGNPSLTLSPSIHSHTALCTPSHQHSFPHQHSPHHAPHCTHTPHSAHPHTSTPALTPPCTTLLLHTALCTPSHQHTFPYQHSPHHAPHSTHTPHTAHPHTNTPHSMHHSPHHTLLVPAHPHISTPSIAPHPTRMLILLCSAADWVTSIFLTYIFLPLSLFLLPHSEELLH